MNNLDTITKGQLIKELREARGKSHKTLAELARCSKSTVIRIEKNITQPSDYTLTNLLSVLSVTREEFDARLYGADLKWFNEDFLRIWDAGYAEDFATMEKMHEDLKCKPYYNPEILAMKQALLLCDSVILRTRDKNYKAALATLHKALKLTTSKLLTKKNTVRYENLKNLVITLNEYRILKLIANNMDDTGQQQQAIELYQAIIVSLENKPASYELQKRLLPTTYFNLSTTLLDENEYSKSLEVTECGLKFCSSVNEFKLNGEFFWNKGRAYFGLKDIAQATLWFQHSYNTVANNGKHDIAEYLKNVSQEKYGITIGH